MTNLAAYLWLVMVFGPGNPTIWKIMNLYGSVQRVCEVLRTEEVQKLRLPDYTFRKIRSTTEEQVDRILTDCENSGISVVCYEDADYPESLQKIVNPPCVLFYRGDIRLLNEGLLLTIIGTRHATDYSIRVARKICYDLVQMRFVPVTGFAVGLDILANQAALEQGMPSVAVMGCGLDIRYPAEHFALKDKIAEQGIILTEFLPGTTPSPRNFPIRNRILSGLSVGTFIVQAPKKSGTLITAGYAMEQGKDVFCIPPADIFDVRYAGVIDYLRDGAVPVFDARDIAYAYYTGHGDKMDVSILLEDNFDKKDSVIMQGEKKAKAPAKASAPVQKQREEKQEQQEISFDKSEELEGIQKKIYQLIRQNGVIHMDHIGVELNLTGGDLISPLTELELLGYIERLPGKQFRVLA